MDILVILNDLPYHTERSYNGLRLALSLAKQPEVELRVFLMADAVRCAQCSQQTPEGYYNIERMLTGLRVKGVPIGACGTCMVARTSRRSTSRRKGRSNFETFGTRLACARRRDPY